MRRFGRISPPALLLAYILHLFIGELTCSKDDDLALLNRLQNSLNQYLEADQFNKTKELYFEQLKWLAESQLGQEEDNKLYILREFANLQAEINIHNHAIKQFLVSKMRTYVMDKFHQEGPGEPRKALIELGLARARLRAKLTMLEANELRWLALNQIAADYDRFYRPLFERLQAASPRDGPSLGAELASQHEAFKRYIELRPGSSSLSVFLELDKELDFYLECKLCFGLVMPKYSNAAPLAKSSEVAKWPGLFVARDFLEALEQSHRLVARRFHRTPLDKLHRVDLKELEEYQAKAATKTVLAN